VPTFLIEVYRPGLTTGSAAALVEALEQLLEPADPGEGRTRYAGSTLAPADEVCYLRLESPARDAVEALVERLAWTDARISEVIDLA